MARVMEEVGAMKNIQTMKKYVLKIRLEVTLQVEPSCPFSRDLVDFRLSGLDVSQTPFI